MSDPDLSDPSTYAHWVDEHVRFSDTDALGHLNNVAVAAQIETGRVAYVFGLLRTIGAADVDGDVDGDAEGEPDAADAGAGMVLVRLEIDFRSEAHYPTRLRVGSRLLAIGRTSLTVGTGVFAGDRCVATARSVLVAVGPEGPTPLSGPARRRLEPELRPDPTR